ncbi:MAG: hypothetical protein LC620_08105, partial [Halobacteriales archaeon]|nr:hypothetical protein [Halobacteriales archaeon]
GIPGIYTLHVQATAGSASASLAVPWTVTPPTDTGSSGLVVVDATGLDHLRAGVAANVTLTAKDTAGMPFGHTDIVFDVIGPAPGATGPGLLLRTKLHAHDGGVYRLGFTPQSSGNYSILLTPTPLEARTIVLASYTLTATVAAAAPAPLPEAPAPAGTHASPAAGAVGLLLVLAVALGRKPRTQA